MKKYEPEIPVFTQPIFGDERLNTTRCLDCKHLAGSERTPQWLFASDRGYCDWEGRRGGAWNVLQGVSRMKPPCEGYERAPQNKIDLREKAVAIFKARREKQQEALR